MRACVVSRELAPFTGWGVGTYATNMARALADAGHETHVLTAPAPGLPEAAADLLPGVTIHTIDRSGPPASLRHVPCRATQGPLAIFQTLRALHERHPFDYVEFTDVYAEGYFAVQARRTLDLFDRAVLAVRLHSPVFLLRRINRQHALDHDTACVEHMEARALRGADLVLAPSRAILDAIAPDGPSEPRIPPHATHVLPYPFDPSLLSPAPRDPGAHAPARPEVLFAGRLEYRKGVHLLIDAAQRLAAEGVDLSVRIIGVDTATAPGGRSMTDWLRARIAPRFAERFTFEPNRPRADVAAAMGRATVCVVPSLWENFPFALLEAMSRGACVVAADGGGIPEILRDGTDGLLFRAGDAESLTDRLRTALADPGLRAAFAEAAPRRVASLCEPRAIVARLEAIVAEAAEKKARSDRTARSSSADPASSPRPRRSSPETNGRRSVSVLIPFRNLARYLPDCLASVRAQTVPADEIIIIDDGSTDADACAMIERFESEAQIRVIRQANHGLAAARNAGLRAAAGRWVLPLDADDLLAPVFVERALAAAALNPDAVLVTSWMSCFEQHPDRPTLLFVPIGFDRDLLCFGNVASSCTALLDRELILTAGGYDESLPAFEDWDLYCTLARRLAADGPLGPRAAVIPEPLIHNRVRPDSMLRRMSAASQRELHATILAKHPGLPAGPVRVVRMMLPRSPESASAAAPPTARPPTAPPLVARLGKRLRRWSGA